jgi:hypothetical protein
MRRNAEAERVPPILPIVLYQGPTTWTAARTLHAVLEIEPDALALVHAHLPNFSFVLDDLATYSDEDLRARPMAVLGRVALLLLRHVRAARHDVEAMKTLIKRVSDLVRRIPIAVDRQVVFAYILSVADAERRKFEAVLAETLPDMKEEVVTVADQLRLEGRLQGVGETLLNLLRQRFGSQVSTEIENRVKSADKAALDLWLTRVLTASTISEIFKS